MTNPLPRSMPSVRLAKPAIDLGEVNGKVFVNNVSLGLYARIVASEEMSPRPSAEP